MNNKKITKLYYFSFEGETEKWYLEWLLNEINISEEARYKVSFRLIGKNPVKAVKNLTLLYKTDIYHICDYEDKKDDKILKIVIDSIRKAEELNDVKYHLAYNNLTFELWLVLHKNLCNRHCTNNKDYLQYINSLYNEKFKSLEEYKKEQNFKKILSKLNLNDVKTAIHNAKHIMQNNMNSGFKQCEYKKEKYYRENPSLSIFEIIDKIFDDIGK